MSRRRGRRGGRKHRRSEASEKQDRTSLEVSERAERAAMRRAMVQLAYQAAKRDRSTSDWSTSDGSPDSDLVDDVQTLRERSREIHKNDGLGRQAIEAYVSNVVGRGLRPDPGIDHEALGITEEEAEEFGRIVESEFRIWWKICDAEEKQDFGGLQQLILRSVLKDGDIATVPLMLSEEPWRRHELAIETISASRIEDPEDRNVTPDIRMGVRVGERGQAISYFVRSRHSGDDQFESSTATYREVRARNRAGRRNMILHFVPMESRQTRGEPILSPVLNDFHDRRSMLEAERMAAKAAACFAVFIRSAEPSILQRNNAQSINKDGWVEDIEPGMIQYLAPGEEVEDFAPNRPNTGMAVFLETVDRTIGNGINLSYDTLTRNSRGANFSNTRTVLVADRRVFQCWQVWLAFTLCQPYYEMFLEELWLKGKLPMVRSLDFLERIAEWATCDWVPDGWDWLDPKADVSSTVEAVKNRIESPKRVLRRRGLDPDKTLKEIVEWEEALRDLGVVPQEENEPASEPVEVGDASDS